MSELRRYRGIVYDSARWAGFEHRQGDIVVATPPKCGTTWTQMICALLIFQHPALPLPLSRLSPWVDMVTRPKTEVFADLAAQPHRRFIKTHTPLDGLPRHGGVTYLVVGRDPRDVAISMGNHLDNLDVEAFLEARAAAAAVDGIELEPLQPPPARPDDPQQRFWLWVDDDTDVANTAPSLRYTLHHLSGFWTADGIDAVFLHYDDLLADLEGEMRRLAERLGITVAEGRWPALVEAAGLQAMRDQAELTVPGGSSNQWRDPARFFNRGTSGQWRELLDDDGVARYAERVRSLAPPELVDWLHKEPLPRGG